MAFFGGFLRCVLLLAMGSLLGGCDGSEAGPCEDVTCSGHGRCVDNGSSPACVCDPGYRPAGLLCEAESVADGDGDVDGDGDGDSGADGGDDGGLPRGPGSLTFVVSTMELLTTRVVDFDGDGDLDNSIADLGSPEAETAAALLTTLTSHSFDEGWRPCLHLPRVDDRAGPETESSTFINLEGVDTDDPPDPSDDFSGAEGFYARGRMLDGCGEPLSHMAGMRIEEGSVIAGPGTLEGVFLEQRARHCRILGSVTAGGASCDLVVAGVGVPEDLGGAPGPEEAGDLSLLEMVLAGGASVGLPVLAGLEPDVDLDGDGLETYDIDDQGRIVRCIDGDRTVIEGRDCWRDARMADGLSLIVRFVGVSATFEGPEPSWQEDAVGTCDTPPDDSLWDG